MAKFTQKQSGDCHITAMQFKELDILEGMFAEPVNACGYLQWRIPEWLVQLRQQVTFNQLANQHKGA